MQLIGGVREIAGATEFTHTTITPVTVRRLLAELEGRFGRRFGKEVCAVAYPGGPSFYQILVNGANILSGAGPDTVIADGDEVLISPPISGG